MILCKQHKILIRKEMAFFATNRMGKNVIHFMSGTQFGRHLTQQIMIRSTSTNYGYARRHIFHFHQMNYRREVTEISRLIFKIKMIFVCTQFYHLSQSNEFSRQWDGKTKNPWKIKYKKNKPPFSFDVNESNWFAYYNNWFLVNFNNNYVTLTEKENR